MSTKNYKNTNKKNKKYYKEESVKYRLGTIHDLMKVLIGTEYLRLFASAGYAQKN